MNVFWVERLFLVSSPVTTTVKSGCRRGFRVGSTVDLSFECLFSACFLTFRGKCQPWLLNSLFSRQRTRFVYTAHALFNGSPRPPANEIATPLFRAVPERTRIDHEGAARVPSALRFFRRWSLSASETKRFAKEGNSSENAGLYICFVTKMGAGALPPPPKIPATLSIEGLIFLLAVAVCMLPRIC